MSELLTPLDALDALREDDDETPRPDVADLLAHSDGNPMLAHVARIGHDLSEAEAYDAQILAGLVCP